MNKKLNVDWKDYESVMNYWIREYEKKGVCDAIRYIFSDLPNKLEYFENGQLVKSLAEEIEKSKNKFYLKSSSLLAIFTDEILPKQNNLSDNYLQIRLNVIKTSLEEYNEQKKITNKENFIDYHENDWKKFEDKFGASTKLFRKDYGSGSERETITLLIAILGLKFQEFEELLFDIKSGEISLQKEIEVDQKQGFKKNALLIIGITVIVVAGTLFAKSFIKTKKAAIKQPQEILSDKLFGKNIPFDNNDSSQSLKLVITSITSPELINEYNIIPTNEAFVSFSLVNQTNEIYFPDRIYLKIKTQNLIEGNLNIKNTSLNVKPNFLIDIPDNKNEVEYLIKNENGFAIDPNTQISSVLKLTGTNIKGPKTLFVKIGIELRSANSNKTIQVESAKEFKIAFIEGSN